MRDAQVCSSPGAVGRHVKILRRLGVSDTPVTRCGPTIARSFRCGSVVMPNDDADLRVGQRVIDRRDQVVDRAFEPLEERGGHALRPGADVDRRRLRATCRRTSSVMRGLTSSSAARSPSIETSICSPCVGPPKRKPHGVAVQLHPEGVVAVGREGVHDRDAAAGAERRAVDARHLRGGLRHAVERLGGLRLGVADRERVTLLAARR